MKPILIDKKKIINLLLKDEGNKKYIENYINNNDLFINFLIIVLFIIIILFLIYRYLEKKKSNYKYNNGKKK